MGSFATAIRSVPWERSRPRKPEKTLTLAVALVNAFPLAQLHLSLRSHPQLRLKEKNNILCVIKCFYRASCADCTTCQEDTSNEYYIIMNVPNRKCENETSETRGIVESIRNFTSNYSKKDYSCDAGVEI